jgi:CheY-like chemotaxis protein
MTMATLLIAEPDPDLREGLELLFARAGFTVHTAADGTAALDAARKDRPDVVLTNLDLQGMTGAELCGAIRADGELADTPVAILGRGLEHDDPHLAGAQLCGVLVEPFSNTELLAAIQRLAEHGRHDHAGRSSPCAASA